MSGLKSRRKGQRAQCEVVNILKAAGIPAENVGLMYAKGPDIRIRKEGFFDIKNVGFAYDYDYAEVKRRASSYSTLYKHLGENWALFLRDDNQPWLIVQTLDQWIKDRK